jgi:hypothetical protein
MAAAVLGLVYWVFGVGKDAFLYVVVAFVVFAMPVVIIFGITGLVLGIRRLFRKRPVQPTPRPTLNDWYP